MIFGVACLGAIVILAITLGWYLWNEKTKFDYENVVLVQKIGDGYVIQLRCGDRYGGNEHEGWYCMKTGDRASTIDGYALTNNLTKWKYEHGKRW